MFLCTRMIICSLCPSPCFPTSSGPWVGCGLSAKDTLQNKPVSGTGQKCLFSGHMGISNKLNFNILDLTEKKMKEKCTNVTEETSRTRQNCPAAVTTLNSTCNYTTRSVVLFILQGKIS